jgi:predicted glutamine amidotransferase
MFDFKKAALLLGLLSSSVVTASLAFAAETAPGINNFKKPFNEYTWVIAHNGYLDDMRTQLSHHRERHLRCP